MYCIDIISTQLIMQSYRNASGDNERGNKMIVVFKDGAEFTVTLADFLAHF